MDSSTVETSPSDSTAPPSAYVTEYKIGDHHDPESGHGCSWSGTGVNADYATRHGQLCAYGHPAPILTERTPVRRLLVTWSVTEEHELQIDGEDLLGLLEENPDVVDDRGELNLDGLADVIDSDWAAGYEGDETYRATPDRDITSLEARP